MVSGAVVVLEGVKRIVLVRLEVVAAPLGLLGRTEVERTSARSVAVGDPDRRGRQTWTKEVQVLEDLNWMQLQWGVVGYGGIGPRYGVWSASAWAKAWGA